MKTHALTMIVVLTFAVGLCGCSTAPKTEGAKAQLHDKVIDAVNRFKQQDPSLSQLFDSSYGYAVFPTVAKGGIGVGGAYGKGEVFENGQVTGHCDLSQGSIGFQLGGQAYSELIFFETQQALDRFKSGNFAFSAQASAVAVTAGASADANYENGVVVFTLAKGGLMYEASIGGQKFSFIPQ